MAGDYIQRSRHGTVFYFRRRVPLDLRDRLRRSHIYVSLRTEHLSSARVLARQLAAATDQLFSRLRYCPVAVPQGEPGGEGGEVADCGEKHRENSGRLPAGHNNRVLPTSFLSPMKIADRSIQFDYGIVFELDSRGMPRVSVTDAKPGDETAIEDASRRFLGLAKPLATPSHTRPTPTVAEAIQAVLRDPSTKASTKKEYKRAFQLFVEFAGADTPLGEFPQERFAEFADHVEATLDRAARTKSFYITAAQRLFTFYESRNSAVPKITAAGLKPRQEAPAGHDRDAYAVHELEAVFTFAAQFRESHPAKWWVTVASAFLGTRIEELAQAHLSGDFSKDPDSGVHYLQIDQTIRGSSTSPKSVKSKAGWRRVPLHPALVQAGFLRYLEVERAAGATTPFERYWPALRGADGRVKHGHFVSRWGSDDAMTHLVSSGVLSRRLAYFHSMRHTFVTLLAKSGVPEEWRAALAGHKFGGMNSEVYTKKQDVAFTLPMIEEGLAPLALALNRVLA